MTVISVDGLIFTFPVGVRADKYDEWAFYRSQFGKMRNGIKAVDLIVLDRGDTAWFVEVKDYRANVRTKPSELSCEVAEKVFDTLAALLPAKVHANDGDEQRMATSTLQARNLRVVLHLEQPAKHSRLRPRAISPPDVVQKLKRLLKPIDPHPLVSEMSRMGTVPWGVA